MDNFQLSDPALNLFECRGVLEFKQNGHRMGQKSLLESKKAVPSTEIRKRDK
jgi:hypothetical protein